MRSDKEVSQEALRLAAIIRKRLAAKKRRIYAACSAAACLALIIGLSFVLPAVSEDTVMPEGIYSATLFSGGSSGGYVIIGIIGFVLGVTVALYYSGKSKKD